MNPSVKKKSPGQKPKSVAAILKEIDQLPDSEIELVLKSLLNRLDKTNSVNKILAKYRGIAENIWEIDAQQHITQIRSNDR